MAITEEYDFVIVGGGAAGCVVASRLARSRQRPSVLLVEAGGKNDDLTNKIDAERYIHRFLPKANWYYTTVPQKGLNNRTLEYGRGKGLGGSTAVNISGYILGPRDDYDEIARILNDEEWRWENAQRRFKALESYHGFKPDVSDTQRKYLDPKPEDHGTEGNPIGLSIFASTAYKGLRSTAADLLVGAPDNLHIVTDAQIAKVLLDGKKAIGISTLTGQVYQARKEVIITAGSLDTPKILMLSGIGPAEELRRHQIQVLHDSPYVGKNLRDHVFIMPRWIRADHTSPRREYYRSKEQQAEARIRWETDRTGPLAEFGVALGTVFEKSDAVYKSKEFDELPDQAKKHLKMSTVPTHEFILNLGNVENFIDPENAPTLSTMGVVVASTQSMGSVTLQSSDPSAQLLFDPQFLTHPYDRRVAVEATKEFLRVVDRPMFKKDSLGIMRAPKSDDEEDILRFWRDEAICLHHPTGTCRMGKNEGEEGTCIDTKFKIIGVEQLRVIDLSVVPLLTHNHTQSTAYLVGMIGGDKLVAEYGLDG